NTNPSAASAAVTDQYVTDTLNTVFQGRMDIRVHGAGRLLWKDVVFTTDQTNFPADRQNWRITCDVGTVASVQYVGCLFDTNWAGGWSDSTVNVSQCLFQSFCGVNFACSFGMNGCVFQNTLSVFGSAFIQLSGPI